MPSKKPTKANAPAAASRKKAKVRQGSPSSSSAAIFQVKITLDNTRPPIWRRIQTPDCTLGDLHDLIQAAMGWEDDHLHLFEFKEQRFGDPRQWEEGPWGDEDVDNERKIKLSDLAAQDVKKFHYEYDMGDSWRHTIQFEKRVAAEPGVKYPRCVAGERACPPEDCGGPWGYEDLLAAIRHPKHQRHEEILEWIGDDFDPEAFDLAKANQAVENAGKPVRFAAFRRNL